MKVKLDDITMRDGFNPAKVQRDAKRACSMVTKEQWIASMDSLQNNAWQYLHIEAKNEEIEEIEEVKGYNFLPMIVAIIVFLILIAFIILI